MMFTWKQVNVIHMSVGPLESLNQWRSNLSPQSFKTGSSGQVTNSSEVIVSRNAVISSSLDVESSKIEAGEWRVLVLEQMVGDLCRQELVQGLHGAGGDPADELVQHGGLVQLVGVEEKVTELHITSLTKISGHSFKIWFQ